MTSDMPAARQAVVRANSMPILRGATTCRADERLGPVGLVRLVSTDVRDVADITAWLAPLPFQGMVFSIWPEKHPCADRL